MKFSKYQKGFTLIELIFVAGFIAAVCIGGGILYVAVHFISKFW